MSEEKECENCTHFRFTDRPTNKGTCGFGTRGSVTYGQYVCGNHTRASGVISDKPRSEECNVEPKSNKKPNRSIRNIHPVTPDTNKELRKMKGVHYD